MRECVYVIICFLFMVLAARGQVMIDSISYPSSLCELPAVQGNNPISRPYLFRNRKPNHYRTLNITVTYLPAGTYGTRVCADWPTAAMQAFDYAIDVWSDVLQSTQAIGVEACWATSLSSGTLGSAGSNGIYALQGGGLDPTYFPSALTEHLLNQQINGIDIIATFNGNRSDWYYGTDANPGFFEYDFASVVIHELGHGLGFFGLKYIDDGVAPHECNGVAGTGCIGFPPNYIPSMFDRFVDKTTNGDQITSLANPGTEIYDLLTGAGGGLSWDEKNFCLTGYGGMTSSPLYTPGTYAGGSTYSHFDELTFPNELMTPFLTNGQAIHDVGLAANVMYNLGWTTPFPINIVTDLTDTGTGSLRSVIERTCDSGFINFQGGLNGDILLPNGELSIDKNLTINGPGINIIALNGNNSHRIFNISNTGNLNINNLTLKDGWEGTNGGAIFLDGGILTLNNITLMNNKEGGVQKSMTVTPGSTINMENTVTVKGN